MTAESAPGCGTSPIGGSGCGSGGEAGWRPVPKPLPDDQVTGWRRWLRALFGLDLRSLAAARIAMGTILLIDLAFRSRDLAAHYSDDGVFPRYAFVTEFYDRWQWSVHFASGEVWFQALLFIIHALLALGLLVGYRTRLVTLGCWLLLVSLHHRNELILKGGDALLRCLLFFAIFLPWGARWSIDSALHPQDRSRAGRWLGGGSIGWIGQLLVMYYATMIFKWHEVWGSGRAVGLALENDIFASSLGIWLRDFPFVNRLLTWGAMVIELLGPTLIFIPLPRAWNRRIAVTLMIALHLGFMLVLQIGLFSWIAIAAWLALVPGEFWDWCGHQPPRRADRLTVGFDADCFFCRRAAALIRGLMGLPRTAVIEAQLDPELAEVMQREESWVVRDADGVIHARYDAFLVLLGASPVFRWLRPIAAWSPIAAIGDRLYRWVASHRHRVAWTVSWLRPGEPLPPRNVVHILWQSVAVLMLVYVLLWNLRSVDLDRLGYMKHDLGITGDLPWGAYNDINGLGKSLFLGQKWNMFAPYPSTEDGWFVIEAETVGGEELDIYNRGGFIRGEAGPVDLSRPPVIADTYVRQRWRKYLFNIWLRANREHRVWFGKWLTRTYNRRREGDDRIKRFQIYFMLEKASLTGEVAKPVPIRIHSHDCFK